MIRTQIIAPPLGDQAKNCKLMRWFADDLAKVEMGDHIATLETKKATLDLEAECAGILHHGVAEGSTVEFETSVGFIEHDGIVKGDRSVFLTLEMTEDDLRALDDVRGSVSRDEFALQSLRKQIAEQADAERPQ